MSKSNPSKQRSVQFRLPVVLTHENDELPGAFTSGHTGGKDNTFAYKSKTLP